jgi:hypothetical protein
MCAYNLDESSRYGCLFSWHFDKCVTCIGDGAAVGIRPVRFTAVKRRG